MKTSRYIHLTILVFIFGATLTLFINAKNHEEEDSNKPKINLEDVVDVKKIDDFSVIVVKENAKVTIKKNVLTSSIHSYDKNHEVIKEHYNFKDIILKNDTLFVNSIDPKYKIIIHANSLQKIIGLESSEIYFDDFYNDTIQVDLTKSKLTGILKSNLINSFKINAKKQSKINLWRKAILKIDSITKKRNFVRKRLNFKIAEITLKDKSSLSMPKPTKLTIEADSLSTYDIRK